MFDLILKYLPIFVFILPFFLWLDKKKRYFHNSKFYLERAQLLKLYEEESRRENITEHERNAFAQAYVGSEKVGFKDIEIVKIKYPNALYEILQKVIKIKTFIKIEFQNGSYIYISKLSAKKIKYRWIWIVLFYFSSILVLDLNNYGVLVFNYFEFSPFYVSSLYLIIWQLLLILMALTIIILAVFKFFQNEVLSDLIADNKLFEKNDNTEENVFESENLELG